jgi:hypothetical protein
MPSPIVPNMPTSTVSPNSKDVETAAFPGHDGRFGSDDSAEGSPPFPRAAIPPFGPESGVGTAGEDVEAVGTPRGDARRSGNDAAQGLPAGPSGGGDVRD